MRVVTTTVDDMAARLAYDVWRLRQQVFVVEQDCPYPDLDGRDLEPTTRHVVLLDGDGENESVVGTQRVLDHGVTSCCSRTTPCSARSGSSKTATGRASAASSLLLRPAGAGSPHS